MATYRVVLSVPGRDWLSAAYATETVAWAIARSLAARFPAPDATLTVVYV